jgi:hypothetical protein
MHHRHHSSGEDSEDGRGDHRAPSDPAPQDHTPSKPHNRSATARWLDQVDQQWPRSRRVVRLAAMLAHHADPATMTVDLDPATAHRLLLQMHAHPCGLRLLLIDLVNAGLLVTVHPATGTHLGRYLLTGLTDADYPPAAWDDIVEALQRWYTGEILPNRLAPGAPAPRRSRRACHGTRAQRTTRRRRRTAPRPPDNPATP